MGLRDSCRGKERGNVAKTEKSQVNFVRGPETRIGDLYERESAT